MFEAEEEEGQGGSLSKVEGLCMTVVGQDQMVARAGKEKRRNLITERWLLMTPCRTFSKSCSAEKTPPATYLNDILLMKYDQCEQQRRTLYGGGGVRFLEQYMGGFPLGG